jgi:hypothetical protein
MDSAGFYWKASRFGRVLGSSREHELVGAAFDRLLVHSVVSRTVRRNDEGMLLVGTENRAANLAGTCRARRGRRWMGNCGSIDLN